jgi:hypothetical protein
MTNIVRSRREYLALFPRALRQEAFKYAHDIRKFEIELYWKRATYFWTIIAAAFAGYFTIEKVSSAAPSSSQSVIASLGLILSVAWYLVSRGSKFWQENWERHLDLLEDEQTGPLHKTVINQNRHSALNLTGPYAYSPTRINQNISLLVMGVWIILILRSFQEYLGCIRPYFSAELWTLALAIVGSILLAVNGRTRMQTDVEFEGRTRRFEDRS